MREKCLKTKDNAKYVASRFESYRRRYDVEWSFYKNENQRDGEKIVQRVAQSLEASTGSKKTLSDGMKQFLDALVDDMVRNMLKEHETSNGGIAK